MLFKLCLLFLLILYSIGFGQSKETPTESITTESITTDESITDDYPTMNIFGTEEVALNDSELWNYLLQNVIPEAISLNLTDLKLHPQGQPLNLTKVTYASRDCNYSTDEQTYSVGFILGDDPDLNPNTTGWIECNVIFDTMHDEYQGLQHYWNDDSPCNRKP